MIEPIVVSVTVARSPEDAFELFTTGVGRWWPFETHSATGNPAVLEPREGGRFYETEPDGTEHEWGIVTAWEPPHRLAISWHVNPEMPADTTWEVVFEPEGEGTRVTLEHRDWDRLAAHGIEKRADYAAGWRVVLGAYAEVAGAVGSLVRE